MHDMFVPDCSVQAKTEKRNRTHLFYSICNKELSLNFFSTLCGEILPVVI